MALDKVRIQELNSSGSKAQNPLTHMEHNYLWTNEGSKWCYGW